MKPLAPLRRLDPAYVRSQIELLRTVQPDLWDDEVNDQILLNDMLEAETDLHAFLGALLDRIGDVEEHFPGLEERISKLRSRRDRYEAQIATLRSLVLKLMDAAGVRRVELDQATLLVHPGHPKVIITDEALLPDEFFRIKREPDKAAIKACIATNKPIPGAEMSNTEPVLHVRVK